jgi:hypothetical protein
VPWIRSSFRFAARRKGCARIVEHIRQGAGVNRSVRRDAKQAA